MKWLWHGKLKAWFDRHPFAYDWAKKASYALLGLAGTVLLGYWQRVRLDPLWNALGMQLWMPLWLYVLWGAVTASLLLGISVTVRKSRDAKSESPYPKQPYKDFRSLEYQGVNWRWSYYAGEPKEVTPHCLMCDAQLLPRERNLGATYLCPVCAHSTEIRTDWRPLMVELEIRIKQQMRKLGGDPSPVSLRRERF